MIIGYVILWIIVIAVVWIIVDSAVFYVRTENYIKGSRARLKQYRYEFEKIKQLNEQEKKESHNSSDKKQLLH